MSSYALKLVAVCFLKKSTGTLLLQQCEELFVYGVLSQLARFTELQYKDLATLPDKMTMTLELSQPETLKKLQQVCNSARTQYLITGVISSSNGSKGDVQINYLLYDAKSNQYVVNGSGTLTVDTKQPGDGDTPNIQATELNQLINEATGKFIQNIFGQTALPSPESLAPLSTSLPAMQLILRAHQTTSPQEKIMLYEAATREDIQLETAYYHLARIYKSELQYEKSVLYYREALKVSHAASRNKAIYATEAGISLALLGRHDLALQWWLRALEYDRSYINPYFNIANTYEDQEKYEQAEQYFLKAQELAPDDFRTFFNLARLYSKMGSWDKALNQYRFQLASEDGDPWCHSDVATCYLNLGDLQNAKHHLEKTVALDPEGEAGQYAQLILSALVS
jgi:tetratricopeptide (TPR) repeat protein